MERRRTNRTPPPAGRGGRVTALDPREVVDRAVEAATSAGSLPLPPAAGDSLEEYVRLLLKWQERVNLTGWATTREVAEGIAAGWVLATVLPSPADGKPAEAPGGDSGAGSRASHGFGAGAGAGAGAPGGASGAEAGATGAERQPATRGAVAPARVVDLGSGNGVPALPCSLARPDLHWVLVEPRRKRAAFLQEVVRTWDRLDRIRIFPGSLDQLPADLRRCAGVTSRALWPVPELLERVRAGLSATWVAAYPGNHPALPPGWREAAEVRYAWPGGAHGRACRYDWDPPPSARQ